MVKQRLLLMLALLLPWHLARGQGVTLQGPIKLTVEEWAGARRRIAVSLVTARECSCSDYVITTQQKRKADTIVIAIVGLATRGICADTGPARARVTLALSPGVHALSVTRGQLTDRLALSVTPTRLSVKAIGKLAFILPDTSVFYRPPANSFLVSCDTPEIQGLCADLTAWLTRQPGLVRIPLDTSVRIGFTMYGGPWTSAYQLYEYADNRAFRTVRRCMHHIDDTLSQAVGAAVTMETARGEKILAWSRRSLDEPHIPMPRTISGSRECP